MSRRARDPETRPEGTPGAPVRVILLGLDGFPRVAITPSLAPSLWRLSDDGAALVASRAPLPSTTYPSFATLLTGVWPARHGVRTTATSPGTVPGWAGATRVVVPTLLNRAEAAGTGAAALMGDHELMRVLGADRLARHWPPGGRVEGLPTDAHGYPTNEAVRLPLLRAAGEPGLGFVFGHLNETDTAGHDGGPGDPATVDACRATDHLVGELVDALAPDWARTVLVIVSDHDMQAAADAPPIDLDPLTVAPAHVGDWIADGGSGWVRPASSARPSTVIDALLAVPGIRACFARADRGGTCSILAVAEDGRAFGRSAPPAGIHGGLGAASAFAIVAGGHPRVPALRAAASAARVRHVDWAPTLAAILGLALPEVDGRDLLGGRAPTDHASGRPQTGS